MYKVRFRGMRVTALAYRHGDQRHRRTRRDAGEEEKSEVEIIDWMTERYGDFVRYNPPLTGQTLVLWALPVVLLLLMALILWRVRAKR